VDGVIKVWDLSAGRVFRLTGGHPSWVNCLQIINKNLLASAGDDGSVILWDLEQKTPIQTFTGHSGWVLLVFRSSQDGEKTNL
jgi:WD40 repeat protein